jgi:hypothetical protein
MRGIFFRFLSLFRIAQLLTFTASYMLVKFTVNSGQFPVGQPNLID